MTSQKQPDPPQFLKGRAARHAIWLMTAALVALSCSRVPTALRSKITVTGLVLLASGKPLPGAYLFFAPSELIPDQSAYAVTDSSGAYSVRLISGTYDVDIHPPVGQGLLARTEQVTVSDRHARLDFTFGGYRVTGRLVTPNGALVDSGRVFASLCAPGNSNAVSVIGLGRYSLLLPGGKYSFHAAPADYWSGFSFVRRDSVAIDADTTIDFHLGGISVSGKVLGPDGSPMRNVGVQAKGKTYFVQNRTAADGRYQLYVPTDTYRIWFEPPHPFFIMPRVVGPVTITEPASIDCSLSGVEWSGTVRRYGTNELAPGITVSVTMTGDEDRLAAIPTDSRGDFRFVLEAGQRYDLETYDPASRERVAILQGITASADTTLAIIVPPTRTPSRADSTIKLSIRSVAGKTVHGIKKRGPPDLIEVTLQNTDRDTVTLVVPGGGGFWGRRTPLMDWEVCRPGGPRLERIPVLMSGNSDAVRASQVFKLPPGGERTFTTSVPDYFPYEKSRRYQFRLSYENRPHLANGRPRDPEALRLLRQSTPCKLVSNTLELKVK